MSNQRGVLRGLRSGFWSAFTSSRDRREALRLAARPVVEALEKRVLFTLDTPVNLSATAYAGEVLLQWDPVAGASQYAVLRGDFATYDSASGGHYVAGNYVTLGWAGSAAYLDTNSLGGLAPSQAYPYEVVAFSETDSSDPSDPLVVTTADPVATPTGDSNISAYTGQQISFFATTNELDSPTFQIDDFGDGASLAPQPAPVAWGGPTEEATVGMVFVPGVAYGSAAHIFAAPGEYTVPFSFDDSAGLTAATDFDVTVTNAPLAITAASVHAVAGESFSGVVATLATPDTSLGATDFTGTINWDSTHSSAATFTANDDGTFSISGTHTYPTTGSQTISVTVTGGGTTATGSSDAAITRDTPTGLAVNGTPGGSIVNLKWNAVSGASAYQIFRGASPDSLSLLDTAVASTSYPDDDLGAGLEPGQTYYYAVKAIDSASTSLPSATLAVTTAALAVTSPWNSGATIGEGGSLNLSLNANDTRNPSISINWGDDTTSTPQDGTGNAQASNIGGGTEFLTANHAYANPGEYAATITITSESDHVVTESLTVDVQSNINVTVPDVAATTGIPVTGTIATFTDDAPGLNSGNYTATISWGDGNSSAGTVGSDTGGIYYVLGNHTYSTASPDGGDPLVVTVNGAYTSQGSTQATATVLPPLLVTGPSIGYAGQAASFTAAGIASADASWIVYQGISVIATGSGTSFSFTPTSLAAYSVNVSGDSGVYGVVIPFIVPINASGAAISDGTFLGTKAYTLADGFAVNQGTAFVPAVIGNYTLTADIPLSSTNSLTDSNSVSYTESSSAAEDLTIAATGSSGAAWTYSEILNQITTNITTPVTSGTGGTQTETLTDTYNFSAAGNSTSSGFTFISGETDSIGGTSVSPSTDTWTLTGSKAATLSNTDSGGTITGNSTQTGGDTYTFSGSDPYTTTNSGTTLIGTVDQESSWDDAYSYSPSGGTYGGAHSNVWTDTGNGSYSTTTPTSGTLTGTPTGNYTNSTTGNGTIVQTNSGSAGGGYAILTSFTGGAWVKTGLDLSSDTSEGNWSSSGTGTYSDSTTTPAGNTSVIGSSGSNYDTDYGSGGNLTQTMGSDGNWTTSAGDNTATGSTVNDWSYTGDGTGHDFATTSTGTLSASTSGAASPGSYTNTTSDSGAIHESGTNSSTDTYAIDSDWSTGTWVTTGGTDVGNATDSGHYTYSPTGNFTDITTTSVSTAATTSSPTSSYATSNSTVTGSTNSTYITTWGDSGNSTQTLGADSSWTLTAGTGTSTGTTTNNWSYGGGGTGHDSTTATGSLTDSTGNTVTGSFSNTSSDAGPINDDGTHTSTDTYTIDSTWTTTGSAASWVATGNDVGNSTDNSHYTYSPTGTFTDTSGSSVSAASTTANPTASSATSNSTVTGSPNSTYETTWGDSGNSTQTLASNGNWTTSAGASTATGTTTNNGNYSAGGTVTDSSGDIGTINDPTGTSIGTFSHNSDDSGPINEDGTHTALTTYTIHSNWNGTSWVATGNDTGNNTDLGHYTSAPTGTYNDTTDTSAGNTINFTSQYSSIDGNINSKYATTFGDSGNSTRTLGADSNWTLTAGTGTATGTTTNNWNCTGDGTGTDSVGAAGSVMDGSGTVSIGTYTNNTSDGGDINEDGTHSALSTYTINSNWNGTSWVASGNDTGNNTDLGHYTSSPSGSYTDTTHTSTGNTGSWATSDTTLTGPTHSTYSATWGDTGNSTKTLGSDSNWTTSAGSGTATGTTTNNSSYSGGGPGSDATGVTTTLTTGNLTNNASESGNITSNGDHTTHGTYTIQSHWASGSWSTPTGNYTGDAKDDGNYTYAPIGDFSNVTHTTAPTSLVGNSTFSGDTGGAYKADGGDIGDSTKTLGANGTWSLTAGDSTATGTTSSDWTYDGTGASNNPTNTYTVDGNGENKTQNDYVLDSDWTGTSWALNYGSQDTTVVNSGHYDSETEQPFNITVSGNVAAGTRTFEHSNDWGVTGTQAQTYDDEGNTWITNSNDTGGTISSLDTTTSPASTNYEFTNGAVFEADLGENLGMTLTVNGTFSDNQVSLTSTSLVFDANVGSNGTTTYSGNGAGIVASTDHYAYSGSGSVTGGYGDDDSESAYQSGDESYSESGSRDTSASVSTAWTLDPDGSWRAGNTDSSTTGTGSWQHDLTAGSTLFTNADNNSGDTYEQKEGSNSSYSQNATNAIAGNGTSTLGGSGFGGTETTGSIAKTVTSTGGYSTISYVTSTENDSYDDNPYWTEEYSNDGSPRTYGDAGSTDFTRIATSDSTTVTVGGRTTSATSTATTTESNTEGDIFGSGSPMIGSGSLVTPDDRPSTGSVGTMVNLSDPNGLPVQVSTEVSNTAMSPGEAGATASSATGSEDDGALTPVCFAAGTLVLMADGSNKRIEEIEVDEVVLAASEHDPEGPIQPSRVVEAYRNDPRPLLAVRIAGESILCTLKHPFYVRDKGWTAAEELKTGDELRSVDSWTAVHSVAGHGATQPVFNIHVHTQHTYFIVLPRCGISTLVHNASGVGHHIAVQELIKTLPDSPGKRALDYLTTGPLVPPHGWSGPHSDYNKAVKKLWETAIDNGEIDVTKFSEKDAYGFVKKIIGSDDPAISGFLAGIADQLAAQESKSVTKALDAAATKVLAEEGEEDLAKLVERRGGRKIGQALVKTALKDLPVASAVFFLIDAHSHGIAYASRNVFLPADVINQALGDWFKTLQAWDDKANQNATDPAKHGVDFDPYAPI